MSNTHTLESVLVSAIRFSYLGAMALVLGVFTVDQSILLRFAGMLSSQGAVVTEGVPAVNVPSTTEVTLDVSNVHLAASVPTAGNAEFTEMQVAGGMVLILATLFLLAAVHQQKKPA